MLNKIEEFLRKLNIIFSKQLSDLQEIALVLGGLFVTSIFFSLRFFKRSNAELGSKLNLAILFAFSCIYLFKNHVRK